MATRTGKPYAAMRQIYRGKEKRAKRHAKPRSTRTVEESAFENRLEAIQRAVPARQAAQESTSYEEVMLKSITGSGAAYAVPNEAMLFSAMLSSMSGSMKGVQYRAGMKLGRALYRVNHAKKSYTIPEESVVDLVSFLQDAGYKYVTYAAFHDKTEITIYDKKGPEFGTGLHSFEAGIISGFLSSAHHRIVHTIELQCVHGGAETCKFISSMHTENPFHESEDPSAFDMLAQHIADVAEDPSKHTNWIRTEGFASGYYSLLSRSVFDKNHMDSVKVISAYMGAKVGASLSARGSGRLRPLQIARAIKLLHFGDPIVNGTDPISITISFDRLNSRKEFVDASLAFINALLSSYTANGGGALTAYERIRQGAYVVEIKGRPDKK